MDNKNQEMTFEEYLEFLDDYWEIFGPIPEPEEKEEWKIVKL